MPVKKTILAFLLVLALPLSGCAALLERDYLSLASYDPVSAAGGGPSALRVENYQQLVNAVLYLVTEGEEHGVLNLYNYTRDVETDLTNACLEVVQEDPLGAYAVDYIKHDWSLIVSYYEANITITYRRTPEQVAGIVSVTGSSAIRRELSRTLSSFSTEAVLRVSYFAEDEDYILELVRQAYYDAPYAALGMPEVTVSLYPDAGQQRIVEIGLTYPKNPETLRRRSQELKVLVPNLAETLSTAQDLYGAMHAELTVEEGTGHSSAYDALVLGVADSEGAALAYQLLCDQAGVECTVVRGTLDGVPHFWNIVTDEEGESRHVDLAAAETETDPEAESNPEAGLDPEAEPSPESDPGDAQTAENPFLTDEQLTEKGDYQWDRAEYPACTAPPEPEDAAQSNTQPPEP